MIEHRNVVRLFFNDQCLFDFNRYDAWTLFHSYCFDFSVWEMYGVLLFGGKLVVFPREVSRDPAAFLRILSQQRVTVVNPQDGSETKVTETRYKRVIKPV